jgi:hypothetical protein
MPTTQMSFSVIRIELEQWSGMLFKTILYRNADAYLLLPPSILQLPFSLAWEYAEIIGCMVSACRKTPHVYKLETLQH